MPGQFDQWYARAPAPLQTLSIDARAVVGACLREGPAFRRTLAWLESTQWYDASELASLQDALLARLLRRAVRVPHYQPTLARLGLATRANAWASLEQLAVITKQTIIEQGRRLIDPHAPRWTLSAAHSSGTTGTPLVVYRDMASIVLEHATIWRQWRWAGFRAHDRRATLRGDMVVPVAQRRPPFWRYNAINRQLFMSSYHLSAANGRVYLAALREFRPAAIQAYPSSAYLLARFALDAGVRDITPKAVFTSSEMLFSHQRETIEEAFRCPVFDLYGTTERVVTIGTCEHGTYHVFPEYGIVEFLPAPGQPDALRVVGTALHNLAMPLIRYDAGDLVTIRKGMCPCGRNFPVVDRIEGRADDYVVTPDGRLLGRLDHIFKGATNIVEGQIVQFAPDQIVVTVVPALGYTPEDGDRIRHALLSRTGEDVRVSIQEVAAIPRTKNGKFRAVVSHCTKDWSAGTIPVGER